MRRKYSNFLTIILIIIIVAIIGLLAYLGYKSFSNSKKTSDAGDAVDAFTTGDVVVDSPTGDDSIIDDNNTGEMQTTNTTEDGDSSTSLNGKNKPTYKGFNMVGTIVIPKTNVKYPVLEKVTKKSLENAVAVEWPQPDPVLNTPRNVVIAGHNYRNGSFFSNNKKLSNGDKINITDLDKKTVTYVIYKIFETSDNDASFYNRDTDGKREITLKTCTDDAKRRLIIFAKEQ